MYFSPTLLAFALASMPLISTHPAPVVPADRGGCAAAPPPGYLDRVKEMAAKEDAGTSFMTSGQRARALTSITVKVFFHIVAASTSGKDGYLSDTAIQSQFKVLNDNYAPTGIKFILGTIDRTINASWANDSPGTELVMKKQLRKGDYKALNLYYLKSLRQNSLGYCSFPSRVVRDSNAFYLDGCSNRYDTVPGGSAINFNKGKTTTHEVGHWFGLLHTFEGGSCTGKGDLIADTPAQLSPTYGCPIGRDSCPAQEGLDPIRNYMDYSFDTCYTNFTAMQKTRMFDMFQTYRAAG